MRLRNVKLKDINWQKLKRKRTIYAILLGVVALILAWAFIGAGIITKNFNRQQLVGTENKQQINISGIILTETRNDKKYWEIYGEKGSYNSDNKVALLENVTGNFYNDNAVSMSFESSNGTYNAAKKQIILYKKTHIVIKGGISLYCDRLIWSGSNKDVVATGDIKIIKSNQLLATAKRVLIAPDGTKFRIIGNTVTKLYGLKEK